MDWMIEREQLLSVARKMVTSSLVIETWGNISLRLPDNEQILITPSGRDYLSMKPEDLVCINFQGEKTLGHLNPSSEKWLHVNIYLQNPEVQAIVHVHSVFSSAFAVSHGTVPVILEEFAQVVGHPVETVPYVRCGTTELAEVAANCFRGKRAVLLANHGLVAGDKDVESALRVCQVVERTAQIAVYSRMLGVEPISLPTEDIEHLCQSFVTYDAQKKLL